MDAVFASVVIMSLLSIVALTMGLVALAYRQNDIAASALELLRRSPSQYFSEEQEQESLKNRSDKAQE